MAEAKSQPSRFRFYFAGVFSFILALLYFFDWFQNVENYWQDTLYSVHYGSIRVGDPRILVAGIDDDTIKEFGWPFTRDVHAKLVDKLGTLGVKAIGYDIMFLDPDKRSKAADKALVAATRRSKRVIHLAEVSLQPITSASGASKGSYLKIRPPIDGLIEASAQIGYPNVDRVIDDDGHIRRMEVFMKGAPYIKDKSIPFPSLDVACAAALEGKSLQQFMQGLPQPWIYYLTFRQPKQWTMHPFAAEGSDQNIVNKAVLYSAYQHISVADILSNRLTSEQKKVLKGSLVLIGWTGLGLYDHYPSPFTKAQPGVEFHANTVDNLIHKDFTFQKVRWVMILIILALVWLPVAFMDFPPAVGAGLTLATLIGWWGYTDYKFLHQIRYDFVTPTSGLIVSFIVMIVRRVLKEGSEKKRIQQTFGQFVAPEVVQELVSDPDKAKIGAQKREMTVFFLDIAHFTTISEKMEPEALMKFLNRYLTALTAVIHEEKGTVDKYIGDCIMAFWNAPLEQQDHRVRACFAAIRCQEVIKELNKDIDPGLPEKPAIRIGLNTGVMNVGFTGSNQKLQYTVIGDEVNLGSRLEGANKFFGSDVMVSEACYDGAKDKVEARVLGQVRVVGKSIPIRVYELVGVKGKLSAEWVKALPLYHKGVELFLAEKFAEAKEAFGGVLKLLPGDKPSKLYHDACEDYVNIPPMGDWRVFNLQAK